MRSYQPSLMASINRLEKQLKELAPDQASQKKGDVIVDYSHYVDKPVEFLRDVLHFICTPQQEKICRLLMEPPYRVLAISANKQGKSAVAARLAWWWFLTRKPAKIISTAPNEDLLKKVLWSEIRACAREYLPDIYKKMGILDYERSPQDIMFGKTARDATSFQGKHGPNQFFIFDEATGVDPQFFEATESMFKGEGHAWLCLFNPTDTASRVYNEYQMCKKYPDNPPWHIVILDAREHPNIIGELKGLPKIIPNAMDLDQFNRIFYGNAMESLVPEKNDIQWPPPWAKWYIERTGQEPRWFRPGPIVESRLLGRYPTTSVNSIWSEGSWLRAVRDFMDPLEPTCHDIPHIGCDVARYGDDYTAIHVRCGPCSWWHEEHNGLSTVEVTRKLELLAKHFATEWNSKIRDRNQPIIEARHIPIKVDDDGVGGGVVDLLEHDGYNVTGINAQSRALRFSDYPTRRDELWFYVELLAREEVLDLSRLPKDLLQELRRQAMAPTWELVGGKRKVAPKDQMKDSLGRSPDSMDALNLAYASEEGGFDVPEVVKTKGNPYTDARDNMPYMPQ